MKKRYYIVTIILVIFTIIAILLVKKNSTNRDTSISQNIYEEYSVQRSKKSYYNNPIVPEGFKKVETETASWELENGIPKGWNNGLVIEDEVGNQFVWVPVKKLNYTITKTILNELDNTESRKESELVGKYGGFYIARYEAGLPNEITEQYTEYNEDTNDVEGIPLSQFNKLPWNYISFKNAKLNATNMYNTQNIKSNLITTRQWLQIIEWFYSSNSQELNTRNLGNFSDSYFDFSGYYSVDKGMTYTHGENIEKNNNILLGTGIATKNSFNNICDLFGNVAEFTDGYVSESGYYSVGGYFDEPSITTNGSFRVSLLGVKPLYRIGFRVVLYLP